MDDNKFEKDVRRRLEGLKMQPSDAVWEKVDKRINQRSPRTRFAWFFIFALLALVAGGIYYLDLKKDRRQHVALAEPTPADSLNMFQQKDHENLPETNASQHDVEPDDNAVAPAAPAAKTNIVVQENLAGFQRQKPTVKEQMDVTHNAFTLVSSKLIRGRIQVPGSSLTDKLFAAGNKINSNITAPTQNLEVSDNLQELATVKAGKQKQPAPNKWKLGFTIAGGKTLLGSSLFDLDNSAGRAAELYYNGPPNNSNNPPSYIIKTGIRNKASWLAGVSLQKPLGKRTAVSFGLNYQYFSTSNTIGERVTAAESQYSARIVNQSQQYVNHFHYLQVPVSLQLETLQNAAVPVTLEFGASVSQLLSSNALQYQQEIFYQNNSLFNKTQASLHVGVSVVPFSGAKYKVYAGPYYSYGINAMASDGLYANDHLGFVGLRARIQFNNK